jgi:hypothetical protein
MDAAQTIENAAMTASPWEYHAALLPLCFEDSVVAGGITTTAKPGPPILMEFADEAEQRRFLKALLRLPWLAPEVRWAVMKSLGLPARGENEKIEQARTATLRFMVDETAARMRGSGEPEPGGVRAAALQKVAERAGMTDDALAKRIYRQKKRTT